ncbi:MAG TPA: hypothetical protein VHM19_23335 [Polyangiales bacterium]|nr:hypothetical protein [Polyangiales bacterium]
MDKTDLRKWFSDHPVDDALYFKEARTEQAQFARALAGLLRTAPTVISTHVSKSVLLPVYHIERDDLGLALVLRGNFYNWKLSVISERPIEANFDGLFKTTPPVEPDYTGDALHPVYFEGFPRELIFSYYEPSDKRRWSAEIWDRYALWCAVYLVAKAAGGIAPLKWHTRESHALELAEERKRWEAERAVEKEPGDHG